MRQIHRTIDWAVKWAKHEHLDCTTEWDKQQQALKNLKTITVLLHKKSQNDKTTH